MSDRDKKPGEKPWGREEGVVLFFLLWWVTCPLVCAVIAWDEENPNFMTTVENRAIDQKNEERAERGEELLAHKPYKKLKHFPFTTKGVYCVSLLIGLFWSLVLVLCNSWQGPSFHEAPGYVWAMAGYPVDLPVVAWYLLPALYTGTTFPLLMQGMDRFKAWVLD